MNLNQNHPERLEDEVFIGNFLKSDFENVVGYRTKVLGKTALYPETGKPRYQPDLNNKSYPVFVKKWEYDENVQRILDKYKNEPEMLDFFQ